jgi:general secretion pathway protein D
MGGGDKVIAGGGTAPSFGSPAASGSAVNPYGTFPGVPLSSGVPGVPDNFADTTTPPSRTDSDITAGLRTTYTDVNRNPTTVPTLATITGILTNPQFRVAIAALEQRDGVDLLAAPKVTTLSGRQAQIVTADVRTIVTGVNLQQTASGGAAAGGAIGGFPNGGGGVAPTLNYNVQTIPFGPELNVIPYVSSDDVSIQMTLIPVVTDFVGYDDPGPFVPQAQSVAGNTIGIPLTATLPLPRLRTRQVVTSAIVWDGQTVVLGGLIAEDTRKQKDKVPIIGDLPLIGRLFTSESSATVKKNLLIFVTPTILDPSGKRVNDPNNMPYDPNSIPAQSGFRPK